MMRTTVGSQALGCHQAAPIRPTAVGRRALAVRADSIPSTRETTPGLNGGGQLALHTSQDITQKLKYQFGKSSGLDAKDAYLGTAWSVRERLIDAFDKTHEHWRWAQARTRPITVAPEGFSK